MSIEAWRTTALGIVALGQTMFVTLYVTFPWYRSFLGRALFYKALALATILDLFMLNRVWEIPHKDVVFIILYFVLATGVWFQFAVFLHVMLTNKRDDWGRRDSDE